MIPMQWKCNFCDFFPCFSFLTNSAANPDWEANKLRWIQLLCRYKLYPRPLFCLHLLIGQVVPSSNFEGTFIEDSKRWSVLLIFDSLASEFHFHLLGSHIKCESFNLNRSAHKFRTCSCPWMFLLNPDTFPLPTKGLIWFFMLKTP